VRRLLGLQENRKKIGKLKICTKPGAVKCHARRNKLSFCWLKTDGHARHIIGCRAAWDEDVLAARGAAHLARDAAK
ncbi:hypothetical protein A2U01_0066610, partial [Trifolium medium]|nr:hypothetical protein [Trifolium medium]